MVVTDLFLPDFSGGARRTVETARVLSKMGHQVVIFCNKRPNDSVFEKMENFSIVRCKMVELGEIIRIAKNQVTKWIHSILKRKPTNQQGKRTYDSYLDKSGPTTIREKLTDFYRHKFPFHKIIKWAPAITKIVRLIKDNEIDLVYERGPSYGAGIFASKITRRPAIIDFIDVMYWNWALRNATRILSYFTQYQIPIFIKRAKIDTVYTSADISLFDPSNPKFNGMKNETGKIGIYVGGFYRWHGLEYIVQAILNLKIHNKEWLDANRLQIKLIGNGEDFEFIKDLIQSTEVEEYFDLPGKIPFDEVPFNLHQADFCISNNTGDALGLKIFEYMAMGKPILISKIDLVPEVLPEDVVYMVNPSNPAEIAATIIKILDYPEESKIRGEKARKLAIQKYSWDTHGQNIQKSIMNAFKAYRQE